jgi:UDP-3-O-[3-hydroxymyristoyl] N-acetylglucosamine deacetylase
MIFQRTISNPIKVTGIGIHSGKRVTLHLKPASQDIGIVFKRTDIPNPQALRVSAQNVGATENNTAIGHGATAIHTVEHLLSALYGLGIDNIYIDIDGPEVPIMDGSAASFVFLLKEAGVSNLTYPKKFLVIKKTVRVEKDGKWAEISPNRQLTIDSTIVFAHPVIKKQDKQFIFTCENYIKEISRARTFGFLRDVDMLKRKGLAKGGSLANAVVLDDFKVMNTGGLRFEDEFVRHKILDIVGDFCLLGYELLGAVRTYKSGHNVHNLLCRKILDDPSCFEIISSTSMTSTEREWFSLSQFSLINSI